MAKKKKLIPEYGTVTVADYPGLLATVGTIALTGGIPEAIVAAIVASPVVLALKKIHK